MKNNYKREKDKAFDGDQFTHPSYGMLSFHRSSSSHGKNLFGSNIRHGNIITLEISEGEHMRHLHQDSYFSHKKILEVDLSSAQFAELITTLNQGSGIPCTIKWRERDGAIDECPQYSAKQEFDDEFKRDMKGLSTIVDDSLKKVEDMMTGTTLKKGDLKVVLSRLTRLKQQLASNIPFVGDQFTKHIERTVSTAKAEIDSMVTHAVMQTGLEHIKDTNIMIEDKGDKK